MKLKIGIYNLHMQARGGGEKRTLALAEHLSRSHEVWFFVNKPPDLNSLKHYFAVDLSRVKFVTLNESRHPAATSQHRPGRDRWDTTAAQLVHFRQIKSFKLDLFINNSYGSNLPCPAARGIYMCMFPHQLPVPFRARDVAHRAYHRLIERVEKHLLGCRATDFIDSYPVITANSRFTAGWVRKIWERDAEVIYSACDQMGPPVDKEKIILHVGRFIVCSEGAFFKQQHILLDVFNRLTHLQRDGWQLHFVGSVTQDAGSRALVARLKEVAGGRPVFFHFDADFGELRSLYRRASLYWHSTGYGFPASEHPSRQEHFGISTVEAMSAGAVPVVINSGGQKEIVTHAVDGFLWDDLSALAEHTTCLIDDPHLWERLSRQAILSSAKFSRAGFNASIDSIIKRLMCEGSSQ